MVEHWSSNPEDAGSFPSRKALELFATGPGLGLIMYIFTTLEFPTHNFDKHLVCLVKIVYIKMFSIARFNILRGYLQVFLKFVIFMVHVRENLFV